MEDFTPIAQLANVINTMVVSNSVPANNLKDFIAYAKANPGKLNYATAGQGSTNHLSAVLFEKAAGITMVHVPTTAWVAMGLVFDGRYRPLVWPLLAAGAGVLALLPTPTWPDAEPSPLQRWAVQARGLALVCGLAAPLLWWQEGLANTQAWAAGLMWVCLAVATHRQLRGCAGGAGAHAATQPQPANNTANAPRSAE